MRVTHLVRAALVAAQALAPVTAVAAPVVGLLTPAWSPPVIQLVRKSTSGEQAVEVLRGDGARREQLAAAATTLTTAAAAQPWDPRERLGQMIGAALAARGAAVRPFAVARPAVGGSDALRRDQLPDDPAVQIYLDVTLRLVAMVQHLSDPVSFRPGAVVEYLWISGDGHPLAPRGRLVFNGDVRLVPRVSTRLALVGADLLEARSSQGAAPEDVAPGEQCAFKDLAEMQQEPGRLWRCFDEGLEPLASRVAATLPAPVR
jgi:hypothetical protein